MNQKGRKRSLPREAASCLIDSAPLLAYSEVTLAPVPESGIIRDHNADCFQGETEHLVWNKGKVHR